MERLTNEQAKQAAIKKAWGEYWTLAKIWYYPFKDGQGENYKNALYNHGRLTLNFVPEPIRGVLYFDMFENLNGSVYPKSLIKLDNNNGWTRIEPDGSNLPTNESKFKLLLNDKSIIEVNNIHVIRSYIKQDGLSYATHYKPIEKELLPIY